MIENEQQYQITKNAIERFEAVLAQSVPETTDTHPLLQKAMRDGVASEIEVLKAQVAEYERLRAGGYVVIELDSLLDIPELLIRARAAVDMSGQVLADLLGVDAEQIAIFERTSYATASLAQVQAAAEALGVSIHERVLFPFALASAEAARPD